MAADRTSSTPGASGASGPREVPLPGAAADGAAVTALLRAWSGGDASARDALMPAVYAELRRRAARALRRERVGHTLVPTALVHEAYLRLASGPDGPPVAWEGRGQFYGVAARLMRQILVDHARARGRGKRGGGARAVTLGQAEGVPSGGSGVDAADVLALHDALERLAALDPEQARLVELRYFAGLTIAEAASALGVSPATAKREWAVARAWLRQTLGGP